VCNHTLIELLFTLCAILCVVCLCHIFSVKFWSAGVNKGRPANPGAPGKWPLT